MAERTFWVGTVGPLYYNDAVEVNDLDPLDPRSTYGGVGTPLQAGLVSSGSIKAMLAPVIDEEVLRLVDVGAVVGNVIGPAAATDEAIVRFDGASGKLLQDSNVLISDAGNITLPDGATIGQAAGPLIAFDDTSNYLEITGCNVGIGTTAPTSKLHVVGLPAYANNAAAVAGGLTAGAFYRTNADPDSVCVVH